MGCNNRCNQGRDECPTPMICGPQDDHLAPYAIGALVVAMLAVITLVLTVLSWR